MVIHATARLSKVGSEWEICMRSPSIARSNPPGGTGHTMFGSGNSVQDRVHLDGLANESACAGSLSTGKDECQVIEMKLWWGNWCSGRDINVKLLRALRFDLNKVCKYGGF